jgi:hypothetical protein
MNGGKRKAEGIKQKAIKANDQSGIKSFTLVIRFNSFLLYALRLQLLTASIITGSGTVLIPVPVQWSGLIRL